MSDVINFSDKLKEKRKKTIQERYDAYCEETDDIVEEWVNSLLDDLIESDVADDSVEFSRDFVFASEAVRSLIYRSRGDTHMFQEIADKMLDIEWFDDERIKATWMVDAEKGIDLPSAVDDAAEVMSKNDEGANDE